MLGEGFTYACKFYVDDGYSGVDFTRPAHVEMMKDIQDGKVGIVIVKDQSVSVEITLKQADLWR